MTDAGAHSDSVDVLVPVPDLSSGPPDPVALATWHMALSNLVGAEIPHQLLGLWLFPERGGAVLLKWLGEVGRASAIRAAATISVPYDLGTASRFLERPVGRIYYTHFVSRLKSKALDLLARFPRVHPGPGAQHHARQVRAEHVMREVVPRGEL